MMDPKVIADVKASWAEALLDSGERFVLMWRAKAILYVVLFVFLVSACGVWTAWLMNAAGYATPRDVHLSIITFAAAVAVSGAVEGTSAGRQSGFVLLLAFGIPLLVIALPVVWVAREWLQRGWTDPKQVVDYSEVLVGIALPTLVWWFFNSPNERFASDASAAAAGGGDPMRNL